MAVPLKTARSGFYVCSSVFTALSVYGMALYVGEAPVGGSLASTAAYAAAAFGSLGGIVYFGMEWDARKREQENLSARSADRPGKTRRD